MKLTIEQIEGIRDQAGIDPIPQTEAVIDVLQHHFGDHTFYVDEEGLRVWESIDDEQAATEKLQAYRVASWADEEKNALVPHDPIPMDSVVELASEG